jgi:hypothetical protein
MAKKRPDKLLSQAKRVKVFNSGLEAWLYDHSYRDALKASGAFEVDTDEAAFNKAMQGFVRAGRILCYALMQDDSLDIAVAVGAPPAAGALGGVPWRKPQAAFLRLPTGRLVIESSDALTLRKLKPTDPGAEIKVPPGDYRVTLNRVDWDVLAEDEIEWDGPSEYITLTGGPAAKPVRGQPAILPWDEPAAGDATWKVEHGAYAGAAIFDDDLMAMRIAISQAGVTQLGLTDKSVTLLSVPSMNFECALVWVRGDRMQGAYYDRLERLHPPVACRGKEWALCNLQLETPGDQTLFCMRRDAQWKVPRKARSLWHPATMQVLQAQALERK